MKRVRKNYQEALTTPGTLPCKASSLKEMRERPNLRITALGLPVKEHLLTNRTGDEFLGILDNLAWAA
jgi:hypothetical protein